MDIGMGLGAWKYTWKERRIEVCGAKGADGVDRAERIGARIGAGGRMSCGGQSDGVGLGVRAEKDM